MIHFIVPFFLIFSYLSIGVVIFSNISNSVDEIIEKADRLMYRIKHINQNNIKYQLY